MIAPARGLLSPTPTAAGTLEGQSSPEAFGGFLELLTQSQLPAQTQSQLPAQTQSQLPAQTQTDNQGDATVPGPWQQRPLEGDILGQRQGPGQEPEAHFPALGIGGQSRQGPRVADDGSRLPVRHGMALHTTPRVQLSSAAFNQAEQEQQALERVLQALASFVPSQPIDLSLAPAALLATFSLPNPSVAAGGNDASQAGVSPVESIRQAATGVTPTLTSKASRLESSLSPGNTVSPPNVNPTADLSSTPQSTISAPNRNRTLQTPAPPSLGSTPIAGQPDDVLPAVSGRSSGRTSAPIFPAVPSPSGPSFQTPGQALGQALGQTPVSSSQIAGVSLSTSSGRAPEPSLPAVPAPTGLSTRPREASRQTAGEAAPATSGVIPTLTAPRASGIPVNVFSPADVQPLQPLQTALAVPVPAGSFAQPPATSAQTEEGAVPVASDVTPTLTTPQAPGVPAGVLSAAEVQPGQPLQAVATPSPASGRAPEPASPAVPSLAGSSAPPLGVSPQTARGATRVPGSGVPDAAGAPPTLSPGEVTPRPPLQAAVTPRPASGRAPEPAWPAVPASAGSSAPPLGVSPQAAGASTSAVEASTSTAAPAAPATSGARPTLATLQEPEAPTNAFSPAGVRPRQPFQATATPGPSSTREPEPAFPAVPSPAGSSSQEVGAAFQDFSGSSPQDFLGASSRVAISWATEAPEGVESLTGLSTPPALGGAAELTPSPIDPVVSSNPPVLTRPSQLVPLSQAASRLQNLTPPVQALSAQSTVPDRLSLNNPVGNAPSSAFDIPAALPAAPGPPATNANQGPATQPPVSPVTPLSAQIVAEVSLPPRQDSQLSAETPGRQVVGTPPLSETGSIDATATYEALASTSEADGVRTARYTGWSLPQATSGAISVPSLAPAVGAPGPQTLPYRETVFHPAEIPGAPPIVPQPVAALDVIADPLPAAPVVLSSSTSAIPSPVSSALAPTFRGVTSPATSEVLASRQTIGPNATPSTALGIPVSNPSTPSTPPTTPLSTQALPSQPLTAAGGVGPLAPSASALDVSTLSPHGGDGQNAAILPEEPSGLVVTASATAPAIPAPEPGQLAQNHQGMQGPAVAYGSTDVLQRALLASDTPGFLGRDARTNPRVGLRPTPSVPDETNSPSSVSVQRPNIPGRVPPPVALQPQVTLAAVDSTPLTSVPVAQASSPTPAPSLTQSAQEAIPVVPVQPQPLPPASRLDPGATPQGQGALATLQPLVHAARPQREKAALDTSEPDASSLSFPRSAEPTAQLPGEARVVDVPRPAARDDTTQPWARLTPRNTILLQLEPQELGPVLVQIRLQDDKLVASFRAASPEARTLLHTHLPALHEALNRQGFQSSQISILLPAENVPGPMAPFVPQEQLAQSFSQGRQGEGYQRRRDRGEPSQSGQPGDEFRQVIDVLI